MPFPSMFGGGGGSSSAAAAKNNNSSNSRGKSQQQKPGAANLVSPHDVVAEAANPRRKPSSFREQGGVEVSFEEEEVSVGDDDSDDDGSNDDDGSSEEGTYETGDGEGEGGTDGATDDDDDDDEFEEYTVYDEETIAATTVAAPTTTTTADHKSNDDNAVSSSSTHNTVNNTSSNNDKVRLYHQGATPLFLRIEESDWHGALQFVTLEQCETWVQSTGTMATTFQWSLWKRLPLHEACRRQAPAWFISRLLREYPEAAALPTQFGELPLHLAVECGALPEVVNVLLVAHWPAIAARDQGGRTPLDILHDVELLNVEDARVVLESLERSHDTWIELHEQVAYEKQQAEEHHRSVLQKVMDQHEAEMAEEFQQHADLIEQVQHLTVLLERLQDTASTQQVRIDSLTGVENSWRERVDALERSLEVSRAETSSKKDEVATLARMLVQKNRQIENLEAERDQLQSDLHATVVLQQDLASKVAVTEHHLHQLVTSYCGVQDTLARQYQDVRGVVQLRGAHKADPSHSPLWKEASAVPPPAPPPSAPVAAATTASSAGTPSSPRRSPGPSAAGGVGTPPRKPPVGSSASAAASPQLQHQHRKSPTSSHHNSNRSAVKEEEKKQDDTNGDVAHHKGSGNNDNSNSSYVESADEAMALAAAAARTVLTAPPSSSRP